MSAFNNNGAVIRKIEWSIEVAATWLLIAFHLILMVHAGGLWRDEVHTAQLATLPSVAELWDNLQYASFPVLWLLVLRFWTLLTGGSDFWLRLLGLLVGVSIIGALWWNARSHSRSLPFFSLLLLGFNPTVIRYGDSVRAYGFGMFLILMTFGMIWKVVDSPNPRRIFLATLAAVLSVQCLYQNAVLLLAICIGGLVVTLRHGRWKTSLLLVGIGMIAAMSLLPYIPTIARQQDWDPVVEYPINLGWLWSKISESIEPSGPFVIFFWVGLIAVAVGFTFFSYSLPSAVRLSNKQRDLSLFSCVTLLGASAGYILFLQMLSYKTEPWYYIALLALIAVSLDASLAPISSSIPARICRISSVLFLIGLTVHPVWQSVHTRHTNIDLIASTLQNRVSQRDLILVNPWFCGVTFERYYAGEAPWMTVPSIGYHKFHRYDLIKQAMKCRNSGEAVKPILLAITDTLRSGNRVWLVGKLPFLPKGQALPTLPPAPYGQLGWYNGPYEHNWALQAGYYIQTHASYGEILPAPVDSAVSDYENLELHLVQGWR